FKVNAAIAPVGGRAPIQISNLTSSARSAEHEAAAARRRSIWGISFAKTIIRATSLTTSVRGTLRFKKVRTRRSHLRPEQHRCLDFDDGVWTLLRFGGRRSPLKKELRR